MRIYLACFLIIATSLALMGSDPSNGTLHGTVRDGTGAIVPGAAILIQHWQIGKNGKHSVPIEEPLFYADSQGQFLVHLPPGLYDVFISYPTLSPVAQKTKVEAGKEVMLNCELSFSPLVESIE